MPKRFYLFLAVLFFSSCIAILLVADPRGFVRGFIGDMTAVAFLYTLVESIVAVDPLKLGIGIFSFALLLEIAQYLMGTMGIHLSGASAIIVGSTFDWLDLLAYALGTVAIYIVDIWLRRFYSAQRG